VNTKYFWLGIAIVWVCIGLALYFGLRNSAEDTPLTGYGKAAEQYEVGLGHYCLKDYSEAEKWFRKAAAQGHADAQNDIGLMYAEGLGVRQDHAQAVKWYRKAAAQGDAMAQYNLGVNYAQGRGVQKDVTQAVKWFRRAAAQGDARAQFSLGIMYENGRGVPKDQKEADKWYRKAGYK